MAGHRAEVSIDLPRARPFLKWVGGKRQLLPQIRELLPGNIGSYFEPFVGGGAVFFDLQLPRSILADVNEELMLAYTVVRDAPSALISALQLHEAAHSKDHYYEVRALIPDSLPPVDRAARLIYLNKTCFNGLYRVNRRGEFNVPMGSYESPLICDAENIARASEALRGVSLMRAHFRAACAEAKRGDFVYFDPPYVPLTASSRFTSYASDGFTADDQRDLAACFGELAGRGVNCLLSNSSAPFVLELYRDFEVTYVRASRAVNSVGSKRGKIQEVIVKNY